jgi:hypothetical protein
MCGHRESYRMTKLIASEYLAAGHTCKPPAPACISIVFYEPAACGPSYTSQSSKVTIICNNGQHLTRSALLDEDQPRSCAALQALVDDRITYVRCCIPARLTTAGRACVKAASSEYAGFQEAMDTIKSANVCSDFSLGGLLQNRSHTIMCCFNKNYGGCLNVGVPDLRRNSALHN